MSRQRRGPEPAQTGRERRASTPAPVSAGTFTDVFDRHADTVYRFVYRRCRDHSLTEDITQETFVKAIRSTNEPAAITIGWLITTARNHLIDIVRRETRYEDKLRLVSAVTSDDEVAMVERLRIETALAELSVNHRLVVTLHYIDGLTVPEMADHLDRSPKAVESMLTRARRELRARLEPDGDSPVDVTSEHHRSGGANG